LVNKLDATKRSQIMFMDRDDILNLFVITNLPLPSEAVSQPYRRTKTILRSERDIVGTYLCVDGLQETH